MYRSSSGRHQEWTFGGEVTYVAPVRLPKFVQTRSAQYRLKQYGQTKPTAVVRPFPAFHKASADVWDKMGVVKTDFDTSLFAAREIRRHEKREKALPKISENEDAEASTVSVQKTEKISFKKSESSAGDYTKSKLTHMEFQLKSLENTLFEQQSHLHVTREELIRRSHQTEELEKEKKLLQELLKKSKDVQFESEQQLQSVTKRSAKHEKTLEMSHTEFEHERLARQHIERENRRLENELKITLEVVQETDALKKQLQTKLSSKQQDLQFLVTKLEDDQHVLVKLHEEIKRLQEKVVELEQAYAKESQARSSAEQTESALRNELDKLSEKFENLLKEHSLQLAANNQREQELTKLKHDHAKSVLQHESELASLKAKYKEQIDTLDQQIAVAQSEKQKLEKAASSLKHELEESIANAESLTKEKQNMEAKKNKMEMKAFEYELKVEEKNGQMAELAGQKQKLAMENGKLLQQLADADSHLRMLESKKHDLQRQLDEAMTSYDKMTTERNMYKDQSRNYLDELEKLRGHFELTEEEKEIMSRQLQRANTERQQLATQLDQFDLEKQEDLETQKKYFEKRLSQSAEENETLSNRVESLEKIRTHLKNEIEDLQSSLDTANSTIYLYEKKMNCYERAIEEWEHKCNNLLLQLSIAEDENHTLSSMAEKLQRYLAEAGEEITTLKVENDNVRGELRNAKGELEEAAERVREAENQRRRIAEENESLNKSLEESEMLIAAKVEKIAKMQMEIDNFNSIIEARLAEKAAEFELTKKTLKEAMETLEASFELETANHLATARQKKLVEKKLEDVEILLEQANLYRLEAQTHVKQLQEENRTISLNYEASQRAEKELQNQLTKAEKLSSALEVERDELQHKMKNVEAEKKDLEAKTLELDLKLSEKSVEAESLSVARRKLENDLLNLQSQMDFVTTSLHDSERKRNEADVEIVLLKDRLVHEQENLMRVNQVKRDLETRVTELEGQIEKMERDTAKLIEQAVAKSQQQVLDLENDLKSERRKLIESQKTERHAEKHSKELQFLLNEERQRAERMTELVDNLERKLQMFKRQREDAEQLASMNLTRCRTLRSELGGASERADAAEHVLNKIRAESKARVLGVVTEAGGYSSSATGTSSSYSFNRSSSASRSYSSIR